MQPSLLARRLPRARARAPAFSGACARCLAVAYEDGLYAGLLDLLVLKVLCFNSWDDPIGFHRFDACALNWGERVEQSGAGEERWEGGVPSGGGASEAHTHA